ncbi:MAG: TVP38/TMEM64 family protein [Thermodesulfobacteriota bacterium]
MKIRNNYSVRWPYLFAAAFFILSISILFLYLPHPEPQEIQHFLQRFGTVAPLVFILICIIKPVIFFIPSMGLTVVAGLLFGPFYGTIYVAIGGAGSSAVAFYLARKLGRQSIERFIKNRKRLLEIDEKMEKEGFKTILVLRLFNLPWDIVSYSAGLSKMRFKDFYLGSLILLLPISFIYTSFGSSIRNPLSSGFLISLTVIIALGGIPYLINKVKNVRRK